MMFSKQQQLTCLLLIIYFLLPSLIINGYFFIYLLVYISLYFLGRKVVSRLQHSRKVVSLCHLSRINFELAFCRKAMIKIDPVVDTCQVVGAKNHMHCGGLEVRPVSAALEQVQYYKHILMR